MYWESPYLEEGVWLRGNLHTHTTVSDGHQTPKEAVYHYAQIAKTKRSPWMDYRFLALTDHIEDTNPDQHEVPRAENFVVMDGREYSRGKHIVAIDCPMIFDVDILGKPRAECLEDYQKIINHINGDGGLAILPHPHWASFDHWTAQEAIDLKGYTAIEIINGDRFNGPANLATDVWDAALTAGQRVWGIGSDDFHSARDFCNAWTFVYARECTKEAILEAFRQGSCYASNGAGFSKLYADGEWIVAECADASFYANCEKTFRFISEGGVLRQHQIGMNHAAAYKAQGDEKYIRVELTLNWGCSAFSQPFFRI